MLVLLLVQWSLISSWVRERERERERGGVAQQINIQKCIFFTWRYDIYNGFLSFSFYRYCYSCNCQYKSHSDCLPLYSKLSHLLPSVSLIVANPTKCTGACGLDFRPPPFHKRWIHQTNPGTFFLKWPVQWSQFCKNCLFPGFVRYIKISTHRGLIFCRKNMWSSGGRNIKGI